MPLFASCPLAVPVSLFSFLRDTHLCIAAASSCPCSLVQYNFSLENASFGHPGCRFPMALKCAFYRCLDFCKEPRRQARTAPSFRGTSVVCEHLLHLIRNKIKLGLRMLENVVLAQVQLSLCQVLYGVVPFRS
jgi:hypothetical protein